MTIETVNPLAIKKGAKASKAKEMFGGGGGGYSDFNLMMDSVSAAQMPTSAAMGMYGDVNSATVLAAAFSGVNAYGAQSGGGAPYLASGTYSGGMTSMQTMPGMMPGSNTPVVPGTDNFTQMDMMNTMNQNNLQLLELQAVMQSNMQAWNTKSNILSADHRAKMAMIEKFTTR